MDALKGGDATEIAAALAAVQGDTDANNYLEAIKAAFTSGRFVVDQYNQIVSMANALENASALGVAYDQYISLGQKTPAPVGTTSPVSAFVTTIPKDVTEFLNAYFEA